jgi:hypothetical protein
MTVSVNETIQCLLIGRGMTNESESTWKETAVS